MEGQAGFRLQVGSNSTIVKIRPDGTSTDRPTGMIRFLPGWFVLEKITAGPNSGKPVNDDEQVLFNAKIDE